jgi:four helix bundle protein
MKLASSCYLVANNLPNFEKNGLSDQLRRSSSSILFNIAEGSGSETDKEFVRFLHISRKSLYETVSILKFIEYEYKNVKVENTYPLCELVGKLLSGLIRKLGSAKIQ